jgi:hypothetical protein
MFEHHSHPLSSRNRYLIRLTGSFLAGTGIVLVSLLAGMAGYHLCEGLSWLDAFVNAAMILSGMGPLAQPTTAPGKLFAGCYALYSGFVVILATGVVFAPVIHRLMHRFHLENPHHPRALAGRSTLPRTESSPPPSPELT